MTTSTSIDGDAEDRQKFQVTTRRTPRVADADISAGKSARLARLLYPRWRRGVGGIVGRAVDDAEVAYGELQPIAPLRCSK